MLDFHPCLAVHSHPPPAPCHRFRLDELARQRSASGRRVGVASSACLTNNGAQIVPLSTESVRCRPNEWLTEHSSQVGAATSPGIIHFSTDGFFLPETPPTGTHTFEYPAPPFTPPFTPLQPHPRSAPLEQSVFLFAPECRVLELRLFFKLFVARVVGRCEGRKCGVLAEAADLQGCAPEGVFFLRG